MNLTKKRAVYYTDGDPSGFGFLGEFLLSRRSKAQKYGLVGVDDAAGDVVDAVPTVGRFICVAMPTR